MNPSEYIPNYDQIQKVFILFCTFIGEIGRIDPLLNGFALCPSLLLSNASLNNAIMGKRIELKKGDLINGHAYVGESDTTYTRKIKFKCKYCGEEASAGLCILRTNRQKSCGCLRHIVRNPYYETRLYRLWDKVKQRCYNPKHNSYHNYGGRGISMYFNWINSPVAFIEYCMKLPGHDNEKLSLDRIEADGNYHPGNLRFTTKTIQNRNRRSGTTNESGYTGVIKTGFRYHAQITVNNKTVHIGTYYLPSIAAKARDNYIIDNKLEGFNLQIL